MDRLYLFLLRIVGFLFLTFALIATFGPRERLNPAIAFDSSVLPDDLDNWLSTREQAFSDIKPGTEKRIFWAGEPGVRTPLAVIYLHGFSASSEEIRPLPDDVASGLGANLYFARLAGHGRTGEAMAAASAEDWVTDLDEALAIGRRIGERVILIGTSTGGTLATLAATDPGRAEGLAGVVLISPNFRLAPSAARLLDLPWVRYWGPLVAGAERSFEPVNADHARWWTTRYPTLALVPLATLMRHVRAIDPATALVPALFIYSPEDKVVDVSEVRRVARGWGVATTTITPALTDQDDPYRHVLAGRILSPAQTGPLATQIVEWAQGL